MSFASRATPEFWALYRLLPQAIRMLARKNYQLWHDDPLHPSLHFKKLGRDKWSARIGIQYRAIGKFERGVFVWDWVGPHAEYDKLM